jgi:hypothetical protein
MKLTDIDINQQILSNPLSIQQMVINDFQDRVNGTYVMADANNTFALLLEYASTLTANAVAQEEDKLSKIYPIRALSFDDIWPHMSDYDYVNFFSTPATTTVYLILSKDYLLNNAKAYNQYYKKVVIPRETIITINDIKFGLYYPIELRLNTATGKFVTLFDTSIMNPLHTLSTNTLNCVEQKFDNMNLLVIELPIYQFECTNLSGEIIPNIGFNQTYRITNGKFYAIRIFNTNKLTGKTTELKQTLAEYIYDPFNPTAKLKINPDENTINIIIPRIYITNNQIVGSITMELYTTQGAINVDFTNIDNKLITADYQLKLKPNEYSDILLYNPTEIIQLTEGLITGGSNGKTFEEARDLIINHASHQNVLINNIDVQTYFNNQQFRIIKYKDNITDRIYYCYKNIVDSQNSIIHTTAANIRITNKSHLTTSTIYKQIDDTITIFPNTIYKYIEEQQFCDPLTDEEINILNLKSKEELVDIYNNNMYTRSPFHLLIIPHDKYPEAIAFNLWNPVSKSIWFTAAHNSLASQMIIKAARLFHLNNGTGGYEIQLAITKLGDIIDLPEEDVKVLATVVTKDGATIILPFEYYTKNNNDTIYKYNIRTPYHLSKDDYLAIYYTENSDTTQWIPLESELNIICLINKNYYPTIINDYDIMDTIITSDIRDNWLGISKHKVTVNLGHQLSKELHTNVDIRWKAKEYETYQMDIPLLYPNDIFDTTIVNDKIVITKTHTAGEQIRSNTNELLYKHKQGETIINQYGEPIVKHDRSIEYMINIPHIDNKIYISEQPIQINFRNTLPQTLENIFDFIRETYNILGELMELYFKPTKTFGYGQFHIGDGSIIKLSLNMNFKFVFYVPKFVMLSIELRKTIEDTTITLVETLIRNDNINLSTIALHIKEAMPDYIHYVDVLGINNQTSLQTLIRIDEDIQPSLDQKLYITDNGTLAIKKGINIEFKDIEV